MSRRREVRSLTAGSCRPARGRDDLQEPRCDGLGERSGGTLRPDTGWTPGLAGTTLDQLARPGDERLVHAEQRLTEADATRIVVVEIDRRRRRQFSLLSRSRRTTDTGRAGYAHAIDRKAEIVAVAHQEKRRDVPHGVRQA